MINNVKQLIRLGYISKDDSVKNLSQKYLQKARNNLVTMSLLSGINNNRKVRDLLNIPPELIECKDLKLFSDVELLKEWRSNFKGIRFEDKK